MNVTKYHVCSTDLTADSWQDHWTAVSPSPTYRPPSWHNSRDHSYSLKPPPQSYSNTPNSSIPK